MICGAGEPLTLQSNRALRPSMTSRTSILRVNRGSLDGVTLRFALEVNSSAKNTWERQICAVLKPSEQRCSPLAVLSLHVYVPLSSSCTEFSSRRHLALGQFQ